MSYSFKGRDTYSSVPGLNLWIDGRYGVTSSSNLISFVNDLGSFEKHVYNNKSQRQPTYEDGKWIKFISQTGLLTNLTNTNRDTQFIHNGRPYGMYYIINPTMSVSTPADLQLLSTTSAGGTGIQTFLQPLVSNGRFAVIIRNNGVVVRTASVTNLLNTGSSNYTTFPQTFLVSSLFLGSGITNNQTVRFGNLSSISTASAIASAYSQDQASSFNIGSMSSTIHYCKIGMLLLYDWTGYSVSDVNAFDLRVRTLLAEELPNFT
jgi:hypothetical protein